MGFSLYEIDKFVQQQLDEGISYDEETGEVISEADLDKLVNDKEDSYVLYIKSLNAEIKALEDEKKQLDSRIKRSKKKAETLQNALLRHMQLLGKKKLSDPRYEVRTRISHPVVIDNEQAIIDKGGDFVNTKVTINKTAVKKNIDELEGLAHIEDKTNISIK